MPSKEWSQTEASGQQAVERVHSILRELRQKYSMERAELVAAVSEQVGDVRAELEAVRDANKDTNAGVAAVQRQVNAMISSHDGPADLQTVTRDALDRLGKVDESVKRATDEIQLMKTALMNDRIRREARLRQGDAEEADCDLRLRQLEESNAAVRAELHAVKSVNVEMLQSVSDLVDECKYDAPTSSSVDELRRLREDVLDDLQNVRNENAAMKERVNATVDFCLEQERKRSSDLSQLEGLMVDLHARPSLPDATMHMNVGASETRRRPERDAAETGLVHTPRVAGHNRRAESSASDPASFRGQSFRDRIADFYAVYNPEKLRSLNAVLREYAGAEDELMEALEVHYGAFGYFASH